MINLEKGYTTGQQQKYYNKYVYKKFMNEN